MSIGKGRKSVCVSLKPGLQKREAGKGKYSILSIDPTTSRVNPRGREQGSREVPLRRDGVGKRRLWKDFRFSICLTIIL
jgi:hypothetical protein